MSVDSTQTHKPQCVLSIGGVQVSMVADSGSPFTIIQHGMWDKEFARIVGEDLLPSDIRPVTFTGEPIPMVGYRTLNFEFQGRSAEGKLYVAEKGPSVLGWIDQGELGIQLHPGSKTQVLMTQNESRDKTSEWRERFPKVFEGTIGKLAKFTHKMLETRSRTSQPQSKKHTV